MPFTMTPLCIAQWGGIIILAVCFLQSGLDKVINYKENLSWLQGHFAQSIFKSNVSLLLITLTVFELLGGVLVSLGAIAWILNGSTKLICYGLAVIMLALVCLFLGQRIAKDYAGAAGLIPYVLLTCFTLYLFA